MQNYTKFQRKKNIIRIDIQDLANTILSPFEWIFYTFIEWTYSAMEIRCHYETKWYICGWNRIVSSTKQTFSLSFGVFSFSLFLWHNQLQVGTPCIVNLSTQSFHLLTNFRLSDCRVESFNRSIARYTNHKIPSLLLVEFVNRFSFWQVVHA